MADGVAFVFETRFADLYTVVVVVQFIDIAVVKQDIAFGIDNRDPQILLWNLVDEAVDGFLQVCRLGSPPEELVVVVSQDAVHFLLVELPFPLILKEEEADRKA